MAETKKYEVTFFAIAIVEVKTGPIHPDMSLKASDKLLGSRKERAVEQARRLPREDFKWEVYGVEECNSE